MFIVGVIFVNGIIFHAWHIPRMVRHAGEHLPSSDEFMRKSSFLMASGAVSLVSWTCAVILGSLRGVPYSFAAVTGVYFLINTCAVFAALKMKSKYFKG